MPRGQEAAAGEEEVIFEAEPDAAELLLWKHLWPPNTKSFSFSSYSLFMTAWLFISSLCLWPSPTRVLASLFLFLAERMKYVMWGKTHLSVMSSLQVEEMHPLPCFSVCKQTRQAVDLLVLLCKEDAAPWESFEVVLELHEQLMLKQMPGNCYQVLALPEIEREVREKKRKY